MNCQLVNFHEFRIQLSKGSENYKKEDILNILQVPLSNNIGIYSAKIFIIEGPKQFCYNKGLFKQQIGRMESSCTSLDT